MLTQIEKPVGRPASKTALPNTVSLDDSSIPSFTPHNNVTPSDCPKYEKCSAPICPLDSDWPKREHLKGERVCLYLRELGKWGVLAKLKGSLPRQILEVMLDQRPLICAANATINSALKRAARTNSKLIQPGHRNEYSE